MDHLVEHTSSCMRQVGLCEGGRRGEERREGCTASASRSRLQLLVGYYCRCLVMALSYCLYKSYLYLQGYNLKYCVTNKAKDKEDERLVECKNTVINTNKKNGYKSKEMILPPLVNC